jgi:UDPglucose 6-dehydrogenase
VLSRVYNKRLSAPPGAAIQDFKHPDRIVVGTEDDRAKAVMTELYRPLDLNAAPILYTGRRAAS